MLSKVIVHGSDRSVCLKRMGRALEKMVIQGIKTNKELHHEIIVDEEFMGNNYSTNFLAGKLK